LLPDGRQLANRARAEASNYLSFYGDRIPAQLLADRLASFIHLYTLYWSVRPFGASLLLAVADAPTSGASQPSSASLFMLDPAGEAHRYFGTAVGKGRQQARTEIERLALSNLTCREAVVEVAKIIHKCHDEKDKTFELEMSWVCAESGWQHQRVPKDVAEEAQKQALAALEAMED
jgi:20S proteasome subunit alpha 7